VAGEQPAQIISPAIKVAVQLDDAASPASRLFSQALTAAGANSSFDPLPVAVAAAVAASGGNSSLVRSSFYALAFDPYTAGRGNVSGITRLALSSGNASVAVSNLSVPITFTLPRAALQPGAAQQAACAFWDAAAGAYSTAGCFALPNPAPRGHNLSFTTLPGNRTAAATDAGLAAGWTISGPLYAPASCSMLLLDCSLPTDRNVSVFLNPHNPFTSPSVRRLTA
jgi:hypothetical protein